MKYKEFLNENKISLPDYFRKEQELKNERQIIMAHLKHYILWNKNKWDEWEVDEDILNGDIISFEILQTGMLYIDINISESDDDSGVDYFNVDITFSKKDVKDFMKFMEDPDLYKDIKKYNL